MSSSLASLCWALGYREDDGLLLADRFVEAVGVAHTLRSANVFAGVVAAYGIWHAADESLDRSRFTPLVFVAEADDFDHAQRIHRWVWSQGKVPRLIILCSGTIIVASGLFFVQGANWQRNVKTYGGEALTPSQLQGALGELTSIRLRASVTWRDFSLHRHASADVVLLRGMRDLHSALQTQVHPEARLSPGLTNRLIGRLLYTYILIDKGIIATDGGAVKPPDQQAAPLDWATFWTVQDQIDEIFNGSVFPIAIDERASITRSTFELATGFIRRTDRFDGRDVQQSLFDVDLSAVRIETLSAVYEGFLKFESADEVAKKGIVYTRPFLVDFVCGRVADSVAFTSHTTVIDATLGSGIFLVAAFRHIVEGKLFTCRATHLPLAQLRAILTNCLFGIEQSASAAQVAVFSLYLNLLDYVDPKELHRHVRRRETAKVFPALLGSNIVIADFFASSKFFGDRLFDVALGNPPWMPLHQVSEQRDFESYPIDGHEAAEQVTWALMSRYLKPGGRMAVVMPAKSFASPSAKRYASQFGRRYAVDLLVNLSHWRRHLFHGAEQAAALVFARNEEPSAAARTCLYAPALWSQPFAADAMWTLAVDTADLAFIPSIAVFQSADHVFDAFALKPFDRRVKARLKACTTSNDAISLGSLLQQCGFDIRRGVTAALAGLEAWEVAGVAQIKPDMTRFRRKVVVNDALLFAKMRTPIENGAARRGSKDRAHGPRLILARSMQYAYVTSKSLEVGTALNVVHATSACLMTSSQRMQFLQRLGTYLMSDFAFYQLALFAKLWQADNTRAEKHDLLEIVVPTKAQLEQHADWDCGGERARMMLERMGLDDLALPMLDYVKNRRPFENAKSRPSDNPSLPAVPASYLTMLERVFRSTLNNKHISVTAGHVSDSIAEIRVSFDGLTSNFGNLGSPRPFQFENSIGARLGDTPHSIVLSKPVERAYLTVERAYADGIHLINRLFLN